ncbi:MAG: Hydroperoxy fatty acid reductase gpx1 [Flavobacteriia bacterium]|nr:MAG: Hydroperoxy fatty acid reductase gpx1 [Flavobacteriia bacterium]
MYRCLLLFVVFACSCSPSNEGAATRTYSSTMNEASTPPSAAVSIYDQSFDLRRIDGTPFSLEGVKGKRLLLVNTASFCGYTPQYKQLQELYSTYRDQGFVILGFPANNFGAQEPHDNATIQEFCSANYGVDFPMMEKISVKGKDIHPLYAWLTSAKLNGVQDAPVKWNFQKFLIDADGHLVGVHGSGVSPLSEEISGFAKG